MKKTYILCALLLLATSCRPAGTQSYETRIPDDLQITMIRTGCFAAANACPTYEVAIDARGHVKYLGKDVVELVGPAEGKTTENQLRRLVGELQRVRFFEKNDSYDAGDPECLRSASDQPSATLTIRMDGREKSVRHYLGCFGEDSKRAPRDLIELQLLIDEVASTRVWIGKYSDRIRK